MNKSGLDYVIPVAPVCLYFYNNNSIMHNHGTPLWCAFFIKRAVIPLALAMGI